MDNFTFSVPDKNVIVSSHTEPLIGIKEVPEKINLNMIVFKICLKEGGGGAKVTLIIKYTWNILHPKFTNSSHALFGLETPKRSQ